MPGKQMMDKQPQLKDAGINIVSATATATVSHPTRKRRGSQAQRTMTRRAGVAVLFTLFAWICVSIRAEVQPGDNYIVEVWDTDRGLPHSTVTSLAQTADGYLWVGTLHGGLARFDGVRFITYHPGNTPELNSIEVRKLLVDSEGTLWIGLVEGTLVSRRNGRFQFELEDTHTPTSWLERVVSSRTNEVVLGSHFGWLFRSEQASGTNRWKILKPAGASYGTKHYEDRDGMIWYRRVNGRIGLLRGSTNEVPASLPGLTNQQINDITRDQEGRIWVGTPQELARWDGGQFVNMTPTNGDPVINVQRIVAAPDGGLWVLRPGALSKCVGREWTVNTRLDAVELKPSQRPLEILPDSQGGTWLIKFGAGLWHVDASGVLRQIGAEQGLPSKLFECSQQDREGNLWLGFSGSGLACVRPRAFNTVRPLEQLSDRAVRSVCEDADGAVWFGSSANNAFRWKDGALSTQTLPTEQGTGTDITVCPDNEGRLWIGSVRNGAWILQSNQLTRPFTSQEIGTVVRAFYPDGDGRMWIGNEFGLYLWERGRLKHFTAADGFTDAYILSITRDASNTLWMGTATGELRSYRDGKFTSYRPNDAVGSRQPSAPPAATEAGGAPRGTLSGGERFWALLPDHNQTLWIGTLGGGLLHFKDGEFTRYGTQHGLPNEHVSQILKDGRGQLWLGTRGGICRVRREDLERFASGEADAVTFITYGTSDGLPSIECSGGFQPGCWSDSSGRMWFTTVKGPTWVRSGQLPYNPHPPPVFIEELWVDKELVYEPSPSPRRGREVSPTLEHSIAGGASPLRISAGRHYFEFKFTALSLVAPDKVRFRWRLKGAERDWVGGGTDRSVTYSYLPPGAYEFEVQASNNDGVWSKQGSRLQFAVLSYFWETWWFRTLVLLAIVFLLYAAYRIRIARLRALERLRLRIARDLHDDVGANLGSISLLAQVMEKHPSTEDARQIRSIVGQTVDTLRDIVWFIDPQHERLSDLVTRMAETAKSMLGDIPYTFHQTGDFASARLPLDFRRNIMPIFKETLHNIIKHAGATKVEISVCRTKGVFEFVVQDDGRGFALSNRPTGNGLKNIRRRAAEMKAHLEISSDAPTGTRIKLTANTP